MWLILISFSPFAEWEETHSYSVQKKERMAEFPTPAQLLLPIFGICCQHTKLG